MATKANDWTGLTVSDGRYLVKGKLGEGGMGIVYRAQDTRLGMEVVIKVPRRAMLDDPEFAGRFASEIRSLVRLSHPSIVKATDVGRHGGLPFAIMQYLSGGSLEDRHLTHNGQLAAVDPRSVPGWVQSVASALDYIHSQGYVHRDVKPGNILFDGQGYAFLGDFGVIKALVATEGTRSKTVTGAGLVLGTPDYMAPELIMGGEVDGRVDQYALAVTVYEMLCGRLPFEGSTATAVMVLHTTQDPAPLTDHRPNLPDRLSQAVLKGLAKDPTSRYPTCTAFAAAVVAALEASPTFAAGGSQPSSARSESVQIRCSSCGKKIAMSISTHSTLKRMGKSLSCPACQELILVASASTQVLSASPRDPGITPSEGTRVPRAPIKTQVIGRSQTQLLPQNQVEEQHPAKPARLPWIGLSAAAALLVAVLAYALLPRGSREATVPSDGNAGSGPDVQVRAFAKKAPERVETPTTDSPLPAAAIARDESVHSNGPSPDPPPVADLTPANVASATTEPTATPASEAPPEIATVATPGNSARQPEPGAAASVDENRPDAIAPRLAGSLKTGANKNRDQKGDPPALEEILAEPEKYGDQEIAPKGLFRVSKFVNYTPDGTPSIAIIQGGLSVRQTGHQTYAVLPIEGGKTATLELERGLAERLIANGISTQGGVSTMAGASWQKNLAILTLRVVRSSGMSRGTSWTCRVIKAEFLINLDGQRIGDHKPARAFQTYAIAADAEALSAGNGEEWQRRLGTRFTADIGKVARLFKAQRSIARNAASNAIIGNMVDQSIANAARANAAEEAARRGAILSGPVPNGRALFNAEVMLNAELAR